MKCPKGKQPADIHVAEALTARRGNTWSTQRACNHQMLNALHMWTKQQTMQARTARAHTYTRPRPAQPHPANRESPKGGGGRPPENPAGPPHRRARARGRARRRDRRTAGGESADASGERPTRGRGAPPHTPWVGGGPSLRQPGRKTPSPTGSASLRHAPAPACGERPKT